MFRWQLGRSYSFVKTGAAVGKVVAVSAFRAAVAKIKEQGQQP